MQRQQTESASEETIRLQGMRVASLSAQLPITTQKLEAIKLIT
jgi:hypothetical protein